MGNIVQNLVQQIAALDPRRRSPDFRRSLRNALLPSSEGLLVPLLWLVSMPIFVAKLGKDHFGIWMLVNGTIGMGGLLSFGLTDATIKFVSKYRAQENRQAIQRVIQTSLFIYPLLGIVGALVIVGLAPWLGFTVFKLTEADRELAVLALRLGGLGILLRFLDNVFMSALQGMERYDLNSKLTMISTTLMMGLNVVLALKGYGLAILLSVMLASVALSALLKWVFLQSRVLHGLTIWPKWDRPTLREMMSFGFYSGIQGGLNVLATNVDRFIIMAMVGPAAVTYYSLCVQILLYVHTLLARGFSFLFPFASTLFERGDTERLRRIYHQGTFLLVVLACAVVLPIYLFGDSILLIWMGPEFEQHATPILRVLCLRYVFFPLSIVNYYYLLGAGLVRVQALVLLMTTVVMITGMFVLVPKMGAVGAASAQLLGLPFMLFNRVFINYKLFHERNIASELAYYIPVVVPFLAFGCLVRYGSLHTQSIVLLGIGGIAALTVAGLLSLSLAKTIQKAGWIP